MPESECNPSVRRTLLGAACLSLQPLLLNVLSVPVMAYIIRQLGPEQYGQWMVATALLAVCAILASLGLRGAFVRSVAADPESAPTALAEQLGLRLLLSAAAAAIAMLACTLLGYPAPVVWCTLAGAAGLAIATIATTMADLLQALQRTATIAAVQLTAGLALTGAALVAALLGAGPIGMALAYLTGPIVSAVMLAVIVSRQCCPLRVHWNLQRCRALLARSRFFAAQQLLAAGSSQAELLLLPRLVGISQFGFFTAGSLLATRLTALPDGLCTAAYPIMARTWARTPERMPALVVLFLLIAAGGGVAVAVGGMLVAEPLGRWLFPGEPDLFATVVRVTIWAIPLMAVELVTGCALNAAGRDAAQARASVPAAATSLAGSVLLVCGFGVAGACWSMLLRPAVRSAFLAPLLLRTFRPSVRIAADVCIRGVPR